MGHRMFKVTRVHTKGEKDNEGNIVTSPNYSITSEDVADQSLAIR